MALAAGDTVPDVTLMTMTADGPTPVQSSSVLGSGTVVLFGVPGAFTPACSDHHLPGYVLRAEELKAKGVDTVACIAVNDAFVMDAWGQARETGDTILMLADGNGDLTRELGLVLDAQGFGMGQRSQRYSMLVTDGVVTQLNIEQGGEFRVSSAEHLLAQL